MLSDDQEFTATPCRRLTVTRDFSLLHDFFRERLVMIENFAAEVLQNISGFAAKDAHVDRCLERMHAPQEQAPAIAQAMTVLERNGLLMPRHELLERIRTGSRSDSPCRIRTAAWSTRDRPDILIRSMTSFIENFRRFGRHPRLIVNDDSRKPSERAAVKIAIETLSRRCGERIEYYGLEEKKQLINDLKLHKILPEDGEKGLSFAFFGDDDPDALPYGGNYNCSLLMSAGAPVLSIDDDLVCRPVGTRAENGELSIDSEDSWRTLRHFGSRAELLAAAPEIDRDLLGQMELLLGRSVHGLLSEWPPDRLKIGALGGRLWPSLAGTRPGSIPLVVGGLYGDAGSSAPNWLLTNSRARLDEYFSSDHAFHIASTSRILLDSADCHSLTEKHSFKSGYFAFDSRKLSAPFFPIDRNADSLFGLATMLIQPACLFGRIPIALLHDPPDRPAAFEDPSPVDPLSSAGEMLRLLSEDHQPAMEPVDSEAALYGYAEHVSAAVGLNERSFVEMYRLKCFTSIARLLQLWEWVAADKLIPPQASRYFEYYREKIRSNLLKLDKGLKQMRDDGRLERNRGRLRMYAHLLAAWPAIWHHCRKNSPPI